MIQTCWTSRSCPIDPKRFFQINFDLRTSATGSWFLLSCRYQVLFQSPGHVLFYWNNINYTVFLGSVLFNWECSIINRLLSLLRFVINMVITRFPDSSTTYFFYNSVLGFRVLVSLLWVSFFSKNRQHFHNTYPFISTNPNHAGIVKRKTPIGF